jgi:hypothetical protein
MEDWGTPMDFRTLLALGFCLCVRGGIWAPLDAQRAGRSWGHLAIRRSGIQPRLNNAVVEVNKQLQDRAVQLTFEGRSGFLRSALEALQIPVDSQLSVFSRTSL